MDKNLQDELVALRRTIHANPELSNEEGETAKRITKFLKTHGASEIVEGIGGDGIAAIYDFGKEGPCIMFRAELDALPIQEVNEFEYRSGRNGISHKCGHDGHMTILAGLGAILAEKKLPKGKVILLFQPAEENGTGAEMVLADGKFDRIKPDLVFALHNLPGYPLHKVVCRKGSFTPAVKSMIIKLDGKTSHASEPEHGINPALAIAEIIEASQKMNVPQDRDDFKLITPIQIEMGEEAYGISAGHGIVRLTLRSWTNEIMEGLCDRMAKRSHEIAAKHGLDLTIDWTQYFAANENDGAAVEIVSSAANALGLEYEDKERPFKWGEDFGLITDRFRGVMFGIGSGVDCPALHNPDYDFPDELIGTGIDVFYSIADQIMAN